MEGFRIQGEDVLVLGSAVSRNDDEPRGDVGIVPHLLSRGTPAHVHLQDTREGHVSKGGHVEHVVVRKEEEIVSVVEPVNRVHLVLEEVPALVKLVYDQGRFDRLQNSRFHAKADQTL